MFGFSHLEVGIIEFEPINGPTGAARRAWPILCVLRLLLAKAGPVLLHPPQRVSSCICKILYLPVCRSRFTNQQSDCAIYMPTHSSHVRSGFLVNADTQERQGG